MMEFIFSATWAWFVWLVVSIFLGTKKVRGPNFWGPNFSGTKFLGDQKSQGPKSVRGPTQLQPHDVNHFLTKRAKQKPVDQVAMKKTLEQIFRPKISLPPGVPIDKKKIGPAACQ